MEKEIKALYEVIKDYRVHENYGVSEQRITNWINQFAENDKVFILTELKHIFEKVYFSKNRVENFLKGVINKLKDDFGYSTHEQFLDNSYFLDLQPKGKSQYDILTLLYRLLQEVYDYSPQNLGSTSQKHIIYIDDVLCTGNTFFNNLKNWVDRGENILPQLRTKNIDLTVVYMYVSKKFFHKKEGQFYYQLSDDFKNLYTALSIHWIQDEILKPIDNELFNEIIAYKEQVETQVDEYTQPKNYSSKPDFFRTEIENEEFYSSPENRKRLELIFLQKGIEILSNSNVTRYNIRPLGYSLPSYKDFGLGILFFTWRNVPNNTPLVFWYRGRGFMPLFINKR